MKSMKDVESLLKEAENGKKSATFDRITKEAMPFWQGCIDRVKSGFQINNQ